MYFSRDLWYFRFVRANSDNDNNDGEQKCWVNQPPNDLFDSTLPFSSINIFIFSPLWPSVRHLFFFFFRIQPHCCFCPFPLPAPPCNAQLRLPRLPSCSRPYTPCHLFSSWSPFQHLVFSPYCHVICLSCWTPTRPDAPPPLCLCCMRFICILYLPQFNSLLCIWPRERPMKITLGRASGLTAGSPPAAKADAAYFQMHPGAFSPHLLFHFFLLFELKCRREIVHTEEKSSGFWRRVCV